MPQCSHIYCYTLAAMNIEQEISHIQERNKKVEADKAWETSKTKRFIACIFIYTIAGIFLALIKAPDPWYNATIPPSAFIISTLTLPQIKNWWLKYLYKKND